MTEYNIDLGYTPRPWQTHFHQNKKKRNILVVHRQAGKSIAALMELLDCALTKPNQRLAYLAPWLKQARKVLWEKAGLKTLSLKIPGTTASESDMMIRFPNGSSIAVFGADNPDGIRGLGFHGVVLDEYADMKAEVLGQVIMPTLLAADGWLMIIGTPKGIDPLSEMYRKFEKDEDWYARKLAWFDTGVYTPEQIAQQKKMMVIPGQFELELECNFDVQMPDSLISGETVDAAMSRRLPASIYLNDAKILGVDVARYGDDSTVIVCRQGFYLHPPVILHGKDTQQIAQEVIKEYLAREADAIFLDYSGGLGAGVQDQLKQLGYDSTAVHFNGSPRDAQYKNCRAEMWSEMAKWLKEAEIPYIDGLKAQLTGPKYFYSDNGHQLQIESKEDMKARGMPSPDEGDAIGLTFYSPVQPRFRHNKYQPNKMDDWTPFSELDNK